MNKYILMLAAAGLIAAAPAYYAFQAQAEESPVKTEAGKPAPEAEGKNASKTEEANPEDAKNPAAAEPAAGTPTPEGTNE